MLLEYGALIIAIYACMFGPVIAGIIFAFKMHGVWPKIVGGLILLATIIIIVMSIVM